MGFLGDLFNYATGAPNSKYSDTKQHLSKEDIESIVTMTKIKSLSKEEKEKVISAVEAVRNGTMKTSLKNISLGLIYLRRNKDISPEDYTGIMREFENFFAKKQAEAEAKKAKKEDSETTSYDISY